MNEDTEVQSPQREQDAAFVRGRIAQLHQTPSELGVRAGVLLALWMEGWHHIPGVDQIAWGCTNCITLRIHRQLATVDFFDLTKLVFLAHDEALRVEIGPPEMDPDEPEYEDAEHQDSAGGMMLRITARQRGGKFYEDHPTLEAAVLKHRCLFPESEVAK